MVTGMGATQLEDAARNRDKKRNTDFIHELSGKSKVSSIYKPLLHREGHPGAAFFCDEDAVVTDLSNIAAGDIRSLFWVFLWAVLWLRDHGEWHCFWPIGHHQGARRFSTKCTIATITATRIEAARRIKVTSRSSPCRLSRRAE